MKTIKTLLSFACFLLLLQTATAQGTLTTKIAEWERAKAYTKEYLDAMPESGYALNPTPEMRSFADQMLHLTDANYGFTATATGEKSPLGLGEVEKMKDKSKANVTKVVVAGYDYVIAALKKMSPKQLGEKVKFMNRFEMTKEMVFTKDFEHQTHHRGQATVYLRLAGVTPPAEKLF
ncbi:damage-inducible protein DinB [Pedobacter frigidisoli]|uniref:Damage-inducible protein DinB n=1 Tax=Pedobacter frigidisoli TaxID=2530455 RepID=A0A4R0NME4_9SPHI|nr:DinB family protein [Pedobacter frigidisoli]TCD00763.1 damage-inducible protein DinB [Pedobacter frigidisoli]